MVRHKSLNQPRRLLVIKNRAIGDTILMTGPLRLLKREYPHHEIHVLVRWPAGQLLENLPYVDRVISAREPAERVARFGYWSRLISKLRKDRYDFVINFHASLRTALVARALRAERRVINNHDLKARNWLSDLEVPGRHVPKSTIERDLDVLRALGLEVSANEALPEVVLSAFERQEAMALFEETGGAAEKRAFRIFLGIGASRETKRWPPRNYVELMKRAASSLKNVEFVLSTVPEDQGWLREFYQLLRQETTVPLKVRHFEGRSLRQTAQILSRCSIYVGNDSGLKHLAAALGLPTCTFFGPEAPTEWHPYPRDRHPYLFLENLACRVETGKHWCPIPVCHNHRHRCMQELSVEEAWNMISRIAK